MTVAGGLEGADPTDLARLREALALADPEGKLAPIGMSRIEIPVAPEVVRWALENCHLMRNRFTLGALLFFAGWWDDSFVERILERARSAGGGL